MEQSVKVLDHNWKQSAAAEWTSMMPIFVTSSSEDKSDACIYTALTQLFDSSFQVKEMDARRKKIPHVGQQRCVFTPDTCNFPWSENKARISQGPEPQSRCPQQRKRNPVARRQPGTAGRHANPGTGRPDF